MKAIKTKSGKWRVRPVDHYEYKDGKRKTVLACITADTKKEALRLAYLYEENRRAPMTFEKALQKYIDMKREVLSVTTIARSYESIQRNAYGSINNVQLRKFTSELIQGWVNEYAAEHSPKSVANAHGLLMAVLGVFCPSVHFSVTLPKKNPPRLYTPTDEEIKRLLKSIEGTDMEKAVLLSAFGTLRRAELCAITLDDIKGDVVTISKSMVKDGAGIWSLKAPKTPESTRSVKYPHEVIKRVTRNVGASQRLIEYTPDQITRRFPRILKRCGLPHFRFHDLRAYAVSIRHALGIPDQYIMLDGGYKTDAVLKQTYRRTMADKEQRFTEKVNSHFDEMMKEKSVTKSVTLFPKYRIILRQRVNYFVGS